MARVERRQPVRVFCGVFRPVWRPGRTDAHRRRRSATPRSRSPMSQAPRRLPLAVAAVLFACVSVQSRSSGQPGSELEREVVRQGVLARRDWLENGACAGRELGRCDAQSPWLFVGTGAGRASYFAENGAAVPVESVGLLEPGYETPACPTNGSPISRDFCREALGQLQRRGVFFNSLCRARTIESSASLGPGRSAFDLLPDAGSLRLAIGVPTAATEPVSLRVDAVADGLVIRALDDRGEWTPRRVGEVVGEAQGIANWHVLYGSASDASDCELYIQSVFQPIDAGVPQ